VIRSKYGLTNLLEELRTIAIVRALPGLGDFLCAIPALRALRTTHPHAHIALVGLPNLRELVDRFGAYIDELVELPGYPGLPEQTPDAEALAEFLADMRSRRFDLAIQMHGSGVITNALTLELGATRSAGFFLPTHGCPNPDSFLPYVESESEIRRYLRLMDCLGIPSQGEAMEFPVEFSDRQELETLLKLYALDPESYVCLHAGASVPSRCWSGDRFAAVGDRLAQLGWRVVLTGSAVERGLAESIARIMQAPVINLAGRTSLGTLAALLQDSRLLVCNDTGISHLAAALQVPSVVIFSASDPKRWAPLDCDRHRAILPPATVETVLEHIDDLLAREFAYVA
jgi:ADP-heptose:LPS heptosyltransferase